MFTSSGTVTLLISTNTNVFTKRGLYFRKNELARRERSHDHERSPTQEHYDGSLSYVFTKLGTLYLQKNELAQRESSCKCSPRNHSSQPQKILISWRSDFCEHKGVDVMDKKKSSCRAYGNGRKTFFRTLPNEHKRLYLAIHNVVELADHEEQTEQRHKIRKYRAAKVRLQVRLPYFLW